MCQLLPPNMVEVDIKRLLRFNRGSLQAVCSGNIPYRAYSEDAKEIVIMKGSTFELSIKISKMKCLCSIQNDEVDWIIEKNNMLLTQLSASFNEAEWFLKRNK